LAEGRFVRKGEKGIVIIAPLVRRKTEEETFVVCSAIGLETGTAAQDYVGLYGGDSKLLLESLQYIQQAANRILTAITRENSATPA
jgi:hypothetical protein